jgi:hypothetical protein
MIYMMSPLERVVALRSVIEICLIPLNEDDYHGDLFNLSEWSHYNDVFFHGP